MLLLELVILLESIENRKNKELMKILIIAFNTHFKNIFYINLDETYNFAYYAITNIMHIHIFDTLTFLSNKYNTKHIHKLNTKHRKFLFISKYACPENRDFYFKQTFQVTY